MHTGAEIDILKTMQYISLQPLSQENSSRIIHVPPQGVHVKWWPPLVCGGGGGGGGALVFRGGKQGGGGGVFFCGGGVGGVGGGGGGGGCTCDHRVTKSQC